MAACWVTCEPWRQEPTETRSCGKKEEPQARTSTSLMDTLWMSATLSLPNLSAAERDARMAPRTATCAVRRPGSVVLMHSASSAVSTSMPEMDTCSEESTSIPSLFGMPGSPRILRLERETWEELTMWRVQKMASLMKRPLMWMESELRMPRRRGRHWGGREQEGSSQLVTTLRSPCVGKGHNERDLASP